MTRLRDKLSLRIAPVVLANITTRYPYHDSHLFLDGDVPVDPTFAHPAFGNSFDWHSSVHSHWTAAQLLTHFASSASAPPIAQRLHDALARNLSEHNIAAEARYLATRPTYERPYGWAWALALAAVIDAAPLDAMQVPRAPLRNFAAQIAASAVHWLEVLPAPIRHGVHSNTAFALGLMLDACRMLGLADLERAIGERARAWFAGDCDYPDAWERSGNDFLSPGLAEADLMRRLLARESFSAWWRAFLPDLDPRASIFNAAIVPNVSDGQIVHLHGLNLSRAAMLARIGAATEDRDQLLGHAQRLYSASVEEAVGDEYLSTHWLATFAWDAASSIDAAQK